MRLMTVFCAAVIISSGAQAAPKAKEAHICKMSYVSPDNFIPKEMAFWIANDGGITVLDPIIKHFVGKPLAAKILQDDARRLVFTWAVSEMKGKRIKSLGATQYTATYRKASKVVTMRAVLSGADNQPNGKGRCDPIQKR